MRGERAQDQQDVPPGTCGAGKYPSYLPARVQCSVQCGISVMPEPYTLHAIHQLDRLWSLFILAARLSFKTIENPFLKRALAATIDHVRSARHANYSLLDRKVVAGEESTSSRRTTSTTGWSRPPRPLASLSRPMG